MLVVNKRVILKEKKVRKEKRTRPPDIAFKSLSPAPKTPTSQKRNRHTHVHTLPLMIEAID